MELTSKIKNSSLAKEGEDTSKFGCLITFWDFNSQWGASC